VHYAVISDIIGVDKCHVTCHVIWHDMHPAACILCGGTGLSMYGDMTRALLGSQQSWHL